MDEDYLDKNAKADVNSRTASSAALAVTAGIMLIGILLLAQLAVPLAKAATLSIKARKKLKSTGVVTIVNAVNIISLS